MKSIPLCAALLSFLVLACKEKSTTLFSRLSSRETGIDFNNTLKEDDTTLSILNYPYFYNGGGIAVGDINNDGLEDLLFTANEVDNALFLNKGNFEFSDITGSSGIAAKKGWSTGAVMVDINLDGWLDIYICRSASADANSRRNLLYINNGDLTFAEQASKFGLDDPGYSTQASFFDYDRDGDLDMFLINQSDPKYARGYLDYTQTRLQKGDSTLANKLYRNDNNHFHEITRQAGIRSNVFTFSLGISTADINLDGWPDIYVANDFEERDYLYINQGDGTFVDSLVAMIDHNSMYSMGVDVADYNNDLLPDMVVLDMLPEGNEAQKMHLGGDNYTQNNYLFHNGMYFQYMKNVLQRNNGDGTFSEIGQFAGISSTDWSWAPLIADFDNDGRKDLFVTNGYKHDNTNMEFMAYAMDQSLRIRQGNKAPAVREYISHMPGIFLPNYIFRNAGADHFENQIEEWGFQDNTFSHGAAYADLDNDGDLDLITNNTESNAGIYRNNSRPEVNGHYLRIILRGDKANSFGIGAKMFAYTGTQTTYLEQNPVRGFQSSVTTILHLGLGNALILDSLRIVWPDQRSQLLTNIKANVDLQLSIRDAVAHPFIRPAAKKWMVEDQRIDFVHAENEQNDFARQSLLPHFLSRSGPCIASGDVNGDGMPDLFFGGAIGQPGELFLQNASGTFSKMKVADLVSDAGSEDVDAIFFDADGDRDLDLYVVSGGYELDEGSPLLNDRLYLNSGKGIFTKSGGLLPPNASNKTCVRPVDFDNDGDLDLFIGGGAIPGRYPMFSPSKIYFNDSHGNFSSIKAANAPLGIVNDAMWLDLNHDGKKDLIVAGEWMPLKAFLHEGELFRDVSRQWFPFSSDGWWNCITSADFDKDGDMDLIVGNYGQNSILRASQQQPLQLFYGDIDRNGSVDPVITRFSEGQSVTLGSRDDLISQIPILKKKFPDYNSFAGSGLANLFLPDSISKLPKLNANELATVYLENVGEKFIKKELPREAQFAAVHAIAVLDFNQDGNQDLILAGNSLSNRIFLGRDDANHGVALAGDGKGNFRYVSQFESGLHLKGEVRSALVVGNEVLFGVNNSAVLGYRFQP